MHCKKRVYSHPLTVASPQRVGKFYNQLQQGPAACRFGVLSAGSFFTFTCHTNDKRKMSAR